ncbi:hypothetical protein J5N97_014196 [Dioscorea zingiberensis]|uniref:Glutamate-1-semialdehyde 2,1-aminomutase n=1 Tax=Dioscorea zingiberensis TaxID=325984 RepID=A0A9D5HJU4_9LILI|nr:hypothetical protein J5N97_014196 [Dioscorea zingiberensis]
MAGVSGSVAGLSWSSNLSLRPPPRPTRALPHVSFAIRNAISVEKKAYTLDKSEEIFNAAKDLMPGGVNSPVRAFRSVGGQPIVFDSVKGSHMWDVDGNEYIDYVGSWGPAIIGHADDKVNAALIETLKKGTSFGAPCALENVLAEMVISAVPSIEMVRLAYGGAQEYFGITPDVTTLGKVIGGGLPVGAYGGSKEIMQMVAPAGPMYQAGTLSGNPLAMTAGIHTLSRLKEPGLLSEYLDMISSELVNGIIDAGKKAGHEISGGYIRGMLDSSLQKDQYIILRMQRRVTQQNLQRFHRGMLEEGVYLAPSQFEAGFTSLAHTTEDIEKTVEAAKKVLQRI